MGGKLQYVPWLLAFATAVWFTLMARKAERSLVQWALTGAVVGLVSATIVMGLCNARGFPYSDHERTVMHIEWTALAVLAIAVVGWVVTAGLHRHHLKLWHRAAGTVLPPAKGSSAVRPEPKAEVSKPPSGRA